MNKNISLKILENPKLLSHLMEQSYWVKYLNRNNNYELFKKEMKVLYKERISDKVNEVVDGVDMISSIIDSVK